jgi:hypothetical protein
MKRKNFKEDKVKFGHKLHQLQKRWRRAISNGYTEKAENYKRRINELLLKLKKIK